MRITFVLPNLRLYGGIKSTLQMAQALHQLGHQVTVVHPRLPGRDGKSIFNLRKTAVQLVRLLQSFGKPEKWHSFTGEIMHVPYLAVRFLPDADVLVLTWWADAEKFCEVPAAKGRPIHFVRSYETWGGPPEIVQKVYSLPLPRVTNSEVLAGQIPGHTLCAIHNGLDDVFFRPIRPRETSSVTVGLLYRLQGWKRMDDALQVLSALKSNHPALNVTVFGEAIAQRHKIRCQQLGIEYVHLPSGEALWEVYSTLDIFLFTSDETEAFGNPPLEAMAAGCAVVTTAVGAIPAYSEDGVSALHCAPGDTAQMVALIKALIDDPDRRSALADQAVNRAREYRWVDQAKKFESVLESMMAGEADLG